MSTPTLETTGFVYDLDEKKYHAHEALGSTSIKLLSDPDLSLAEARYQMDNHEDKEAYEVGTLGHALVLEGSYDHLIHRLEGVKAYRTNEAKAARDWALNEGLIPINDSEADSKLSLVEKIRDSVMAHPLASQLLQDGSPEVSIFWDQEGVECKGRLDWWREEAGIIVDLKLLRSAQPESVRKQISDLGYYIQRTHYLNGVQKLTGFRPDWFFVTVGKEEPYSVSVHQMAPETDEAANMRIEYALARYRQATKSNAWPGYTDVYEHSLTPWEHIKNEALEERIND